MLPVLVSAFFYCLKFYLFLCPIKKPVHRLSCDSGVPVLLPKLLLQLGKDWNYRACNTVDITIACLIPCHQQTTKAAFRVTQ